MLVLTRKKGQSIIINGNIEIVITAVDGDQVKIGVNAPEDIKIYRKEVLEAIQESNREASTVKHNLEQLRNLKGALPIRQKKK